MENETNVTVKPLFSDFCEVCHRYCKSCYSEFVKRYVCLICFADIVFTQNLEAKDE